MANVSQDWDFSSAQFHVVLHDNKNVRKRHIGLFAANLIDGIRARKRPARLLTTQTTFPLRQQCEQYTVNSTSWRICIIQKCSQALSPGDFPAEVSRHEQAPYTHPEAIFFKRRLRLQEVSARAERLKDPTARTETWACWGAATWFIQWI